MVKFLSSIFLISFLVSCVDRVASVDEGVETVYTLGSVKADRLVSVFNQTCLTHFPNGDAIGKAFESLGFKVAEVFRDKTDERWRRLSHDDEKMTAFYGKDTMSWHGPNFTAGEEDFIKCEVSADLSDPEATDVALSKLKTPNGSLVLLEKEKSSSPWRSGFVPNSDKKLYIAFHQPKRREYVQNRNRPEDCGDLEGCLIWGRSELSLQMKIP